MIAERSGYVREATHTVSHQHGCLNKTRTRATPIGMILWEVGSSGGLSTRQSKNELFLPKVAFLFSGCVSQK